MDRLEYICGVEAEPLHRYKPGGYHPIHLGDVLKHRYKVLHKLGWGGYATVWAASDERDGTFVALKIATAETEHDHEAYILKHLTTSVQQQPGCAYLPRFMDHFTIEGPNGRHQCLVSDIVGMNVGDLVSSWFKDDRLPAKLAKSFARQALLGLDFMHHHAVAHGDIHVRNLALAVSGLEGLSEEAFVARLGPPELGQVSRTNDEPLASNVPQYLVRPTRFPVDINKGETQVKLIDFGEAFVRARPPRTLHTPLVIRPPEAVFEDTLDLEVDLWSMGCMVFELITGQPPFDSFLITKQSLVQQMLESTGDPLPERWKPAWKAMLAESSELHSDVADMSLQAWLEEVYLDDSKTAEFELNDLAVAGELIKSMCKLEPRDRASIKQVLGSPWWQT